MTNEEFKYVFDTFRMLVFFYCEKRINDRMQAEDITSTVFIKLWENQQLISFKNDDALKGYLLTLAKRKCIDYLITSKRRRQREELYEMSNAEMEAIEINAEVINYIRSLIEKLFPKARAIFKMKYIEQKEVKEISKLLNVSPGTISNSLYQSLTTLRSLIKNRDIKYHG